MKKAFFTEKISDAQYGTVTKEKNFSKKLTFNIFIPRNYLNSNATLFFLINYSQLMHYNRFFYLKLTLITFIFYIIILIELFVTLLQVVCMLAIPKY